MADKLKISGVPMMGPDGHVYDVPADEVYKGLSEGGQLVQPMSGPDGGRYWIPVNEIEKALDQGGHLLERDGSPFAPGAEPVIVGHNSAGQPMWGSQEPEKRGFWGSAWDAVKGAATGTAELVNSFVDTSPNAYEQEHGLTTVYDEALRPLERVVEPQVIEAERAQEALDNHAPAMEVARREIGSAVPVLGPLVNNAVDRAGQQYAEGDTAGALGTLGGNAAVTVAPEVVPKIPGAVRDAGSATGEYARGLWRRMNAPARTLNTPVAPGDLTPRERFDAARDMGVNLDRAQATGATLPGTVKKVTEHSLGGRGTYEENRGQNVEALQNEANRILDDAGPANIIHQGATGPMSREALGARVQQRLKAHEGTLTDRPGQEQQAQALLDSASPRAMTRQKFGDAVKNAMDRHRQSILDREEQMYSDLDARLGDRAPDMKAVREKARAIYNQNKRFYENHPEALNGADARVWKWVKDLAGEGKEETTVSTQGAPKPVDTWADLQRARSHLLDLTRGGEFVGDMATGWAKQLTGAIDETMTKAEHTPGLSKRDVQQFRDANALHKQLKETYDNNHHPFYWISRDGGIAAADRLNQLDPAEADLFRDYMTDASRNPNLNRGEAAEIADLPGQMKRQAVSRLFDPAGNGELDLKGFAGRWGKAPKEQLTGLLGSGYRRALDGVADQASQPTVYDAPGSQLRKVIDAPDGTSALQAMFNDSGKLLLTPEEVRQVNTADPTLIPMLRREAVSRIFDPTAAGAPNLENFGARWNRAQKESLGGLLTPDQMTDLDNLASVSRAVNVKSNPSGTAVVMQPGTELGGAVAGLGAGTTEAVMGHPIAGAITAGVAPAKVAADVVASKRMVNPDATADIMEGPRPTAANTAGKVADAVAQPARAVAAAEPAAFLPGATLMDAASGSLGAPTPGAQFKAITDARRNAQPSTTAGAPAQQPKKDDHEGVSTPPEAVTSTVTAEPNDVHDEPRAQRELEQLRRQDAQAAGGTPAASSTPQTGPAFGGQSERPQGLPAAGVYTGGPLSAAPPEGATHEVLHPETGAVIGHVVNGEWVPLSQ